MATYAIGDVHGCFEQLQHLLEIINFDQENDTLWFAGDLVNGGPKPLETLRFIMSLGDKCVCILGNHDVYLLGVAAGTVPKLNDRELGIDEVLNAPDLSEITNWLKQRPFAHYDPRFDAVLVHAGVLPSWDLQQILEYSKELSAALQGAESQKFLSLIVGNDPDTWHNHMPYWDRIKFLYNCFTRMRFCNDQSQLNLSAKGDLDKVPDGFLPWFQVPRLHDKHLKIIFGHWAALLGKTGDAHSICIDTGCVWGNQLTALRLDDWRSFAVDCQKPT